MTTPKDSRVFRTLILSPKPGKEDEVQKLFTAVVNQAQKEVSGILQLSLYAVIPESTSTNTPQIIGQAVYENEAAVDAFHFAPYFAEFRSVLQQQGFLTKPPEMLNCILFAGFQRSIIEAII